MHAVNSSRTILTMPNSEILKLITILIKTNNRNNTKKHGILSSRRSWIHFKESNNTKQIKCCHFSPFPENIRTTLEFVFSFAFKFQIFRNEWYFLLFRKILATSEILGELACTKLHCICSCKVCSTSS